MPKPDNGEELLDLVRLLRDGRFMTAAQIAVETDCCKTTAHKRLRQLQKRGYRLIRQRIREGTTGPKSIAYAIVTGERA